MLHLALICLLVGQVPPPPVPHPPERYEQPSSSAGQSPANPQAQRDWILAHLLADMQAQGKLDAQKRQEVERMVSNLTVPQVVELVRYYQQQLAQAQANLRSLKEYRDSLNRDLQLKIAMNRQEQRRATCGIVRGLPLHRRRWQFRAPTRFNRRRTTSRRIPAMGPIIPHRIRAASVIGKTNEHADQAFVFPFIERGEDL